ncbi:MAG TPA: MFS transporter [Rhizobiales bacterium]|nr:MFS transporter [Hyphomicrobiales bacterium]
MRSLTSLFPLLLAAGVLLAGNGLQGTLIALRSEAEGFGSGLIGLMGTGYFGGFLVSTLVSAKLVRAVGHIRAFSALAAIVAAVMLAFILWVNPYWWIALRFIAGFSFAGLFMVVESWLNDSTDNANRGKVLSIYRIIDLGFVTGGQLLLPLVGIEGFALFAITAMFLGLSLVPISLADRTNPKPPKVAKFDILLVWKISPIACLGCIIIGMTNSSFRMVGPIFASRMGLETASVAYFMSMGIIGGAVLQFPLGWMSDRFGRRKILVATTLGATLAGVYLAFFAGTDQNLLLAGAFAFGAFSLPLYSLSAAHANDRANEGQYVLLASGLMFFFALGATVGPAIAAWAMTRFGTSAFFTYISVVHGSFVVATLWRMAVSASPARASRGKFAVLLRTSPALFKMARKSRSGSVDKAPGNN